MSSGGFGDYLVREGIISPEQKKKALIAQNKYYLLGEIALEENYITAPELGEVLSYMQMRPGIKFGEAAISLGYLTATQLRYLLDIRTRRKVPIGQILVQNGFLSEETLHHHIVKYDRDRKRLKKILVCETTRTVAKLLKLMLSKYGFEVFEAKNGNEAL